jgi:hypothetical protein
MYLAELREELCSSPASMRKGSPLTMRWVLPLAVLCRCGMLLSWICGRDDVPAAAAWGSMISGAVMVISLERAVSGRRDHRRRETEAGGGGIHIAFGIQIAQLNVSFKA